MCHVLCLSLSLCQSSVFFVLVCSLCFGFTGVLDFGMWTFCFTSLRVLCFGPFFDLHITILC